MSARIFPCGALMAIPDRILEELFVTGTLAPLADLAPAHWSAQLRATKIADDSIADAKRANTILRDEYGWAAFETRNGFISKHILKTDNTTSHKIARGQMGGVKAAMADALAVRAVRERIKRLIATPENKSRDSAD